MLEAKAEVESCDQEPIRRLPPELVARICAFSLPHGWFTDCVTRRGPWKVLQLCHAWREVALSMHHCWAEFTLAELKKIMETDKAVDIVTTHLQRSASLPLAVRIWPPADTRVQFRPDLKLFEVLEALKPELHRIRVLHLRCGHGAVAGCAGETSGQGGRRDAPARVDGVWRGLACRVAGSIELPFLPVFIEASESDKFCASTKCYSKRLHFSWVGTRKSSNH